MPGLTTRTQSGTPEGDQHAPQNQPAGAKPAEPGAPGAPLPVGQVVSPPLVEPPNPNDAAPRNPGDPTISLNADGSVANTQVNPASATVPINAEPTPASDPAFVPSPYQSQEKLSEQANSARLQEAARQSENRYRPETSNAPGLGTAAPPVEPRRQYPPNLHDLPEHNPKHEDKHEAKHEDKHDTKHK